MNAPDRLPALDLQRLSSFVDTAWDRQIVPELTQYIEIPAKSPLFDAQWAANGHIDTVVRRAAAWVEAQKIAGLKLEVVRLHDDAGNPRTPVIFFEVPATKAGSSGTVLMYGHLDKQPEFTGWRSDL